jgi:hypothetical protein
LPLPRDDASSQRWHNKRRRDEYVEVGRCGQDVSPRSLAPPSRKVESDTSEKEGDGKVDEDDMLCMFCEQRRLRIEGMHEITY